MAKRGNPAPMGASHPTVSPSPQVTSHPTVLLWRPSFGTRFHIPVRHTAAPTQRPVTKSWAPARAQHAAANQTNMHVRGTSIHDVDMSKANCAAGRYASEFSHGLVCLPCGRGRYQKAPNSCSRCPAGYLARGLAQTKCDHPTHAPTLSPTSAPTNMPSRAPTSLGCPRGKWSPSDSDCSLIRDDVEASVCRRTVASHGCVMCMRGRYKSFHGHNSCTPCEVGRYQDELGQFDCHKCPSGKFGGALGRTVCRAMQPGTLLRNGKLVCSPGRYMEMVLSGAQMGVPDCMACTVGKFQPQAGQSTCLPCKGGHVAARGAFCSSSEQSKDTGASNKQLPKPTHACLAGLYQVLYGGRRYCMGCPEGKFSAVSGHNLCTRCEVDHYQPSPKQQSCIACGAGMHQPKLGSVSCKQRSIDSGGNRGGASAGGNRGEYRCMPGNKAINGQWSLCTCGTGLKYRYHQRYSCREGKLAYGIKTKQSRICEGSGQTNCRKRSVQVPPI
jgi:hypothetical protein